MKGEGTRTQSPATPAKSSVPRGPTFDHNGCDTRNDILARDLEGETFKPGTGNCIVAIGTQADNYTERTITSSRATRPAPSSRSTTSSPLSDAWQKGAQQIRADRQTAVKAKYRLWVTRAEHDAIANILASCR